MTEQFLDQIEADKLNALVDEGKASTEYVSVLPKDQTPEATREIINSVERHIRDVNAFGECAHGIKNISEESFKDMVVNGFKSLKQLEEEQGRSLSDYSLYPSRISYSMNTEGELRYNDSTQYGVPSPGFGRDNTWDPKIRHKQSDYDHGFPLTFILNPQYVAEAKKYQFEKGEKNPKPIQYTGGRFEIPTTHGDPDFENTGSELLIKLGKFLRKSGWSKMYLKDKIVEDPKWALLHESNIDYDAFFSEVNIAPDYQGLISEPLNDGLVVEAEHSTRVIKWMNEIAVEHPEKVMPIYDIHGNLLWPARISNQEIKERFKEKENEQASNE